MKIEIDSLTEIFQRYKTNELMNSLAFNKISINRTPLNPICIRIWYGKF